MMVHRRRVRLMATLAACAFIITQFTSCFSERASDIGGPGEGDDCIVPTSAFGAKKAVITLYKYAFYPDTLRVSAGTSITWVNCDSSAGSDAHTSTSDTGAWSSPPFAEGQSYSRTFGSTGSFPYHCTPHPAMKGVVIVQ
jgi:plastocyanin